MRPEKIIKSPLQFASLARKIFAREAREKKEWVKRYRKLGISLDLESAYEEGIRWFIEETFARELEEFERKKCLE